MLYYMQMTWCWLQSQKQICNHYLIICMAGATNGDLVLIKIKLSMFLSDNQGRKQHGFRYGISDIEIVSQYKYLGIIMDAYLTFVQCTITLSNAGSRALDGIITTFKSLKDVGYNTFKHLYDSGVTPILECGSEVWCYVKSKDIENVQSRAMRSSQICPSCRNHRGYGMDKTIFTQILVNGTLMEQPPSYARQSNN